MYIMFLTILTVFLCLTFYVHMNKKVLLWKGLLERKAKKYLTSILFIPRIFKLVVMLFLTKLFARKYIFNHQDCYTVDLDETIPTLKFLVGNFWHLKPYRNVCLTRDTILSFSKCLVFRFKALLKVWVNQCSNLWLAVYWNLSVESLC